MFGKCLKNVDFVFIVYMLFFELFGKCWENVRIAWKTNICFWKTKKIKKAQKIQKQNNKNNNSKHNQIESLDFLS